MTITLPQSVGKENIPLFHFIEYKLFTSEEEITRKENMYRAMIMDSANGDTVLKGIPSHSIKEVKL